MNPGLPDRLWRHADRPARERAERCCAAMTFEQKVAVALGDAALPLFPFGHGLSYGEYEYGQPRVEYGEATGVVTVSLKVTNVGVRAGAEVVQLYVAAPAVARQPPKQLKGFAKVHLDPGASRELSLRLGRDDLAAFDEDALPALSQRSCG